MEKAHANNPDELPNFTKMTLTPLPSSHDKPTEQQPGPSKDPITCHVLDTTTGNPAVDIAVSLTLIRPFGPSAPFKARTNSDGRVTKWNVLDGPPLSSIIDSLHNRDEGRIVWELCFQVEEYFGAGQSFWPEVRAQFFADAHNNKGHYHVPLLLGPWSYTTYRGS